MAVRAPWRGRGVGTALLTRMLELARARERAHILEGLVLALDNLDAVIRLIRAAEDPPRVLTDQLREGGVMVRAGQTEGSVDLARLAGLNASAVICEVMNPDGTMARMPEDLSPFFASHCSMPARGSRRFFSISLESAFSGET